MMLPGRKPLKEGMSQLLGNSSKILVIQTAYIGDVILATPIAISIHKKYPNAIIDFVVKKGNETLLENHPSIRKVWFFDKKNKLNSLLSLSKAIRKERYDVVINLHRFLSSGLLTILSGSKQKIGFRKNPLSFFYSHSLPHKIGHGIHEVDRNLSLLGELGTFEKVSPRVFPSQQNLEKVRLLSSTEFYCLAPASVWATKQLPKEKWVTLIKKLSGKVYLLGGPEDFELCEQICKESSLNNEVNLAGKLTIMESIALMKLAKRNYVNDSGPMHFASAVNAPQTVFYCSTLPEFGFGPLSDDSKICEVFDLSCRPCGLHGKKTCPEGHFKCGNDMKILP